MESVHCPNQRSLPASAWLTRLRRLSWAMMLMLLVACTSAAQATDGAAGNGPVQSQPGRPATTTASTPQSSQSLNCGSIHGVGAQGSSPRGENPLPAEACLLQAFLHCQPARLDYTRIEVDSGFIHHFRLERRQGHCLLSDATTIFIAPSPPRPAASYSCRAVTMERGRYRVVGCGAEGDILLPARSASPTSAES
ncbi:MAG: hypothetical protein IRZ31_00135 [Thermogemmatispora sp.]|uniref:hypothetical protein n=1 Tax=Thermogemmatispora sp. TaxID=1968838 RepID=UPI00262352E1|nr:hypothetical protein [Thermogemmatispora sp.]MBX5455280.1 hypothetical protein [Thermogemmatispora sp.]